MRVSNKLTEYSLYLTSLFSSKFLILLSFPLVSRKSPPPPTQQPQQRTDLSKKQIPVSPPPTQNQNETTCSSDNDDDVNSSNKRRGSKQKWVPLDITTQEQRERGGYYEAPPQEYKKPGKGKHKYPSNHRYEGYSRAKGKENMGVNGGGEYSGNNNKIIDDFLNSNFDL